MQGVGGGGASAEAKFGDSRFYLACGEKVIRLASKNSVKFDPKSASDF